MKRPINPFKRIKLLEEKTAKLERSINRIDRDAVVNTMEYGKVTFPAFISIITRRTTFMQREINRLSEELNRLKYGDD